MAYDASKIEVLEKITAVREKVGMYLGYGIDGFHHAIYEILDNAVDEHLAGYCDYIKLILRPDGYIQIEDNGRGVPFGKHKTGGDTLEIIFTEMHAGGKFDNESYKKSGGLHGVGGKVVNFCSEEFIVRSTREGKRALYKFVDGKLTGNKTVECLEESGTVIRFKLIPSIFEYDGKIDLKRLEERCETIAFLNKDLTVEIIDDRKEKSKIRKIRYEKGIENYVDELTKHPPITNTITFDDLNIEYMNIQEKEESLDMSFSLRYVENDTENIKSYVNIIPTRSGGTHESAFKKALTDCINEYIFKHKIVEKGYKNFTQKEVGEGLLAVVSVMVDNPKFKGQTKDELTNQSVKDPIYELVYDNLSKYFKKNKDDVQSIFSKIDLNRRAREAAQNARRSVKRTSFLTNSILPGKLADCRKGADYSEIYLCEGDSAGGSAKQGRDSSFQAILPLKGKILNVEKVDLDKAINSEEIKAIIDSLGCGIVPNCDPSQCRYDRIYLMTDADVDGSHIRTLLITFLYKYMKPLIDAGMVYISNPPLYKVSVGRKYFYCYSDVELKEELERIGNVKYSIQRYKGLGEMNPDQLWDTTLNPDTRKEIKLVTSDIASFDKHMKILMGKNVEPRKKFIENNALKVRRLDV